MAGNISHGRGGAGNMGPEETSYTDGGITREGPAGNQGDGPYSTGRGGAGNVGSPHTSSTQPADKDRIPDANLRDDSEVHDQHIGRGGAGNVVHETAGKEHKEGLVEKIKDKLHKDK